MLLDTHVLLWLLADDRRLGPRSRDALRTATAVHVSAASVWEVAIKASLGRLEAPDDVPSLVTRSGLHELPVSAAHAWAAQRVELPHRDPFDHLLVAQATAERMPLLTADRVLLAAEVEGLDVRDARR